MSKRDNIGGCQTSYSEMMDLWLQSF